MPVFHDKQMDENRAEIIRWCFAQYATGTWTGVDLTLAAQAKGLTSRPTGAKAAQPISLTGMYHVLGNPYYCTWAWWPTGAYITKPNTRCWWSRRCGWRRRTSLPPMPTGRKTECTRTTCGARSSVPPAAAGWSTQSRRANGGTYPYFWCVKKNTKANHCTRRAVRVEKVEDGIAAFYRSFQIRPDHVEQIARAVHEELAAQQDEASRSLKRALERKAKVHDERQKLPQAHYQGAIPADLLASEMQRFTRLLAEAEAQITAARTSNADVEAILAAALRAAANCAGAYLRAPESVRRQINQGFLHRRGRISGASGADRAVRGAHGRSATSAGGQRQDGQQRRTGLPGRPRRDRRHREDAEHHRPDEAGERVAGDVGEGSGRRGRPDRK